MSRVLNDGWKTLFPMTMTSLVKKGTSEIVLHDKQTRIQIVRETSFFLTAHVKCFTKKTDCMVSQTE